MQIPHCARPRLKQSVLINISCIENLLVRKKLKLFCISQKKPLFSPLLIVGCVMWFSGRPSWGKKGDKTSCNNRLKRTSFVLSGARVSVAASVAKCAASPKASRSTNSLARLLALIPVSQTFFYVRSTWHHLPSLCSEATQLIDGAGSSCALKYHTLCTSPRSLYCHFEFSTAMDWQGWMTHSSEWSSNSLARAGPGKPCLIPCQTGELAKCLAKGLH